VLTVVGPGVRETDFVLSKYFAPLDEIFWEEGFIIFCCIKGVTEGVFSTRFGAALTMAGVVFTMTLANTRAGAANGKRNRATNIFLVDIKKLIFT